MKLVTVDDILAHHGTKGMKWGTRKSTPSGAAPMHAQYTKGRLARDKNMFGDKGVSRINSRLHEGVDYKQAKNREIRRSQVKATIQAGAVVTAYVLASFGPEIVGGTQGARNAVGSMIANRAETKRGERFAADHFGLGQNQDINAKKNRKGVYNVTSM
jgi:hypothetical protein